MEQITVVLTESAYSDLQDIEAYISQDSPSIARNFIDKIFNKIGQLYDYPTSGKPVPEIKDSSIRELLINRYRIVYQIDSETHVTVLRIIHGARLLDLEF